LSGHQKFAETSAMLELDGFVVYNMAGCWPVAERCGVATHPRLGSRGTSAPRCSGDSKGAWSP